MKRIFSIVLILLVCAFSLCACSPSENEVKKTYEDNGYRTYEPGLYMAAAEGVSEDDLEFYFMATIRSQRVDIMGFKDTESAKECYLEKNKNTAENYAVKRRGRVVAFGEADGVSLL